jgi:hypothetical protein
MPPEISFTVAESDGQQTTHMRPTKIPSIVFVSAIIPVAKVATTVILDNAILAKIGRTLFWITASTIGT